MTEKIMQEFGAEWKKEYEDRIYTDKKIGRISEVANERRKHPRLELGGDSSSFMWLYSGKSRVKVEDVSAGGMCFYSIHDHQVGVVLNLQIEALKFNAIVLDCQLESIDATFMEYRYKVRVQYEEQENGNKIYVLAHDTFLYQESVTD